MKLVNNKIWTCSLQNNIVIFDTKSRDAIRQIPKLPDSISAMEAVGEARGRRLLLTFFAQDGPTGSERVWCTTINGVVLQFDSPSLQELSRFDLSQCIKGCTVLSLLVVADTLWFAIATTAASCQWLAGSG